MPSRKHRAGGPVTMLDIVEQLARADREKAKRERRERVAAKQAAEPLYAVYYWLADGELLRKGTAANLGEARRFARAYVKGDPSGSAVIWRRNAKRGPNTNQDGERFVEEIE